MTMEQFKKQITRLCEYYNKELNETQLYFWYDYFKDYEENNFSQAIRKCIVLEDIHGFPSIVKVYKHITKAFQEY